MLDFKYASPAPPAYEEDFVLWLEAQAGFLRRGRLDQLDRENLIDELGSAARRERYRVQDRMELLLAHFLRCQYQPNHRVQRQKRRMRLLRRRIRRIIAGSPSLRAVLHSSLDKCYREAVRRAVWETSLPASHFPQNCLFTAEQLLDDDFPP